VHAPQRVVVALIVAALLVHPSGAVGAEEHVLNVPADFPTIEAAIADGAKGDVIVLAAGTYDGEIEVVLLVLGLAALVVLFWRRARPPGGIVSPSRG